MSIPSFIGFFSKVVGFGVGVGFVLWGVGVGVGFIIGVWSGVGALGFPSIVPTCLLAFHLFVRPYTGSWSNYCPLAWSLPGGAVREFIVVAFKRLLVVCVFSGVFPGHGLDDPLGFPCGWYGFLSKGSCFYPCFLSYSIFSFLVSGARAGWSTWLACWWCCSLSEGNFCFREFFIYFILQYLLFSHFLLLIPLLIFL